ncbi:MAG TPA: flavin-dependent oxidoreductase [Pseudonocardiaceae bacterium]
MKVLIVGGGIGGLTTALSLHDKGIDCEVYEQSQGIRELGVGINTLPHAIKALAELGLLERLDEVAIRTHEMIMTDRMGNEIWRDPRGMHAGYEVPQFSIHRGHLQGVLYRAVCERLGPDAVHTGRRLVSYDQDDGGVVALFSDREGNPAGTVRADALIGADGIHSVVRAQMYPQEGPPRWSGVMMWRGATDWPVFLDGDSMIIAGGNAGKLVLYPIAPGSTPGHRITNWAVCSRIAAPGTTPPRREDWSRTGRRSDVQPYIDMFTTPHVDLNALVDATEEFYEYPMCDRDPLPAWSQGRVTLLGDAAHPMYPMGSNGGSQSILDARFLARCLADSSSVEAALRLYEESRLPLTAQIVQMNRTGGPEGVIDVVEELAPDGFDDIDDVISRGELEAILKGYATAAGFAREQVNRDWSTSRG